MHIHIKFYNLFKNTFFENNFLSDKQKFISLIDKSTQMIDKQKSDYLCIKENVSSKHKIFLVNDTSNSHHSGCLTVMRSLNKKISNFRIVGRLYNEKIRFNKKH